MKMVNYLEIMGIKFRHKVSVFPQIISENLSNLFLIRFMLWCSITTLFEHLTSRFLNFDASKQRIQLCKSYIVIYI